MIYGLATNGTIASTRNSSARNCRIPRIGFTSNPSQRSAAEQSVREEDEHQHDDDVRGDVLEIRADIAAGERLDEADHESAQDGAREAREPAEDGRGKRLDEQHEPDIRIEERDRRHQHGGGAGHRGPDGEGVHIDSAGPNADELRGLGIVGGGLHHPPELGELEEDREQQHHHNGAGEDDELLRRHEDVGEGYRRRMDERRERDEIPLPAPDRARDALEYEGEPDRREQYAGDAVPDSGAEGDPLGYGADREPGNHR